MRLALRPGNPLEWLALRARQVPVPAAEAWAGQALSGVLVAAVRTGVTARLAQRPGTAAEVAADLGLAEVPTRLLLDCLVAGRQAALDRRTGGYRLARGTRRWLDPEAELAVARFVNATGDYFDWWRDLDAVVRTGEPVGHHDREPDDPYWRRYLLGQLDLARLSAGEVVRKLTLPADARSVLDVGGGHGWYSVLLCRRRPGLRATVFDLPGSARVGREVVAAAGVGDRVTFVDGDARVDPLPGPGGVPAGRGGVGGAGGAGGPAADTPGAAPAGGPAADRLGPGSGGGHDAVLLFNLVHHLTESECTDLFARAGAALRPGGTLAVLDGFAEPARRGGAAAANQLGLFVYLTSGSAVRSPRWLADRLAAAGFGPPRRSRVVRMPGLTLHQARRR